MKKEWKIVEQSPLYQGFFKLLQLKLQHTLFNGGWSDPLQREILHRGHAVGVLPYDPRAQKLLLIEQFRVGALEMIDGPWLIELIAGMIEPGETAEQVARREAIEEAGCALGPLIPVCQYLSSPGSSSETITLYCAEANLSQIGGIHGVTEDGEDICAHVISYDTAWQWLDSGKINTAMTLIALQWFRRFIDVDS